MGDVENRHEDLTQRYDEDETDGGDDHNDFSFRFENSSLYTVQSQFSFMKPDSMEALAEFGEKMKEELREMQAQKERMAAEIAKLEEENRQISERKIAEANALAILKEQEELLRKEQ